MNSLPKKDQQEILVIGDILLDYQYWVEQLPQAGHEETILDFQKNIGGSALNTALGLNYLGKKVFFYGRMGLDRSGDSIKINLERVGLDLSWLQSGGRTGYTLTLIDRSGERTMFADRGASGEPFQYQPELGVFLKKIRLLFLSGYHLVGKEQAQFCLKVAQQVRRAGGRVALDPGPNIGRVQEAILEQMLSLVDIILPNKQELELISKTTDLEEGIQFILAKTPGLALKLGSQGSRLALSKRFRFLDGTLQREQRIFREQGSKIDALDTTGAGDAFNAGLLASFLQEDRPQNWLVAGNRLARDVIQTKGASSLFLSGFDKEVSR